MEQDKKRKIQNGITAASLIMVGLVVVFLFFAATRSNLNETAFRSVIISFLAVYWVLLDFIEPKLLHQFDGISGEQKGAYVKFVLSDFVGYAGVVMFVFSLDGANTNIGMIGAIIYLVMMGMKRKFKEQFLGV